MGKVVQIQLKAHFVLLLQSLSSGYDIKMKFSTCVSCPVPPHIKSGPQSLVIHLNKSAVLECFAEGVPAPRITWRKDGAVLSGGHAR